LYSAPQTVSAEAVIWRQQGLTLTYYTWQRF